MRTRDGRNVPWVAHLGDEARQRNLPDKGVADVEKGRHALNKRGAVHRHRRHQGRALGRVVTRRVALDAGKDGGEEDGDEGEDGRGGCPAWTAC